MALPRLQLPKRIQVGEVGTSVLETQSENDSRLT